MPRTSVEALRRTEIVNGAIRLICAGLYRDRFVRRDGRWYITERRLELDLPY